MLDSCQIVCNLKTYYYCNYTIVIIRLYLSHSGQPTVLIQQIGEKANELERSLEKTEKDMKPLID